MQLTEIVVEGTLKPDGTLELDQKPSLAPGRVTIVLRKEIEVTPELSNGWWGLMQNARKQMEQSGCSFLNENEMQTHIEWLRQEDRVDELLRGVDEPLQKSESP